MRKPIIAGNWKMNKTKAEAKTMITQLIPLVADADCEIVLCAPFTTLWQAVELTKNTNIAIGAENVHFEKSGAFTGEISAEMLVEQGVKYVIIGHSERRQYFAETDETVNKRTKAAIAGGLIPIVCVGELLEQRQNGTTEAVVKAQIEIGLEGIAPELFAEGLVIAYEPVWAIGTGVTATSDQADETIGYIRKVVCEKFGTEAGEAVRIQYGGSMNEGNVVELMNKPEIDGGLIGGASLVADKFEKIVNYNK
ncbi:MAG: triose-phosphate isomerase [Bacillota bacterium]